MLLFTSWCPRSAAHFWARRGQQKNKGGRGHKGNPGGARMVQNPHGRRPHPSCHHLHHRLPAGQAGVDPSLSQVSRMSQGRVPECQTGTGFTPRRQFISKRGGRSPELDFWAHPQRTMRDVHVGFDVPVIRWSEVSRFISSCRKAQDFPLARWRPWGAVGGWSPMLPGNGGLLWLREV